MEVVKMKVVMMKMMKMVMDEDEDGDDDKDDEDGDEVGGDDEDGDEEEEEEVLSAILDSPGWEMGPCAPRFPAIQTLLKLALLLLMEFTYP